MREIGLVKRVKGHDSDAIELRLEMSQELRLPVAPTPELRLETSQELRLPVVPTPELRLEMFQELRLPATTTNNRREWIWKSS